jgi:hypothetical protein
MNAYNYLMGTDPRSPRKEAKMTTQKAQPRKARRTYTLRNLSEFDLATLLGLVLHDTKKGVLPQDRRLVQNITRTMDPRHPEPFEQTRREYFAELRKA